MKLLVPSLAALLFLSALGCERKVVVIEVPPATPIPEPVAKTKTLETSRVGKSIDEFERNATAENQADVKKAFADLDGEIAELETYIARHTGSERAEAAAKLKNMQEYRAAEAVRFAAAQAKAPVTSATPERVDARSGAEKVEDTAHKVGKTIEDAVKDATR